MFEKCANLILENFMIGKNEKIKKRPFMMGCRNYESKNEEEWIFAWLTEDEARSVYEVLKKYFA